MCSVLYEFDLIVFIVDIICIWLYKLVSDDVHVQFLVSSMQYIYQKWSDISIKVYFSHKQRSAVWLNLNKPRQ